MLLPVERALEGLNGIREINSDGMRGRAKFFIKAEKGTDLRELRENIRGRVEQISTESALRTCAARGAADYHDKPGRRQITTRLV